MQTNTQKAVSALDGKIDGLKVRAQKAEPRAKANFDAAMRDIDAKRATVDWDLRSAREESAEGIDSLEAKLDRDLDALKKSIEVATRSL